MSFFFQKYQGLEAAIIQANVRRLYRSTALFLKKNLGNSKLNRNIAINK